MKTTRKQNLLLAALSFALGAVPFAPQALAQTVKLDRTMLPIAEPDCSPS